MTQTSADLAMPREELSISGGGIKASAAAHGVLKAVSDCCDFGMASRNEYGRSLFILIRRSKPPLERHRTTGYH